ncbi:MAG: antitoxin Xre/MbcA/ParS toxin-binding domain-containing protein [Acidobacteriota bacterium]|mgnify:CR=1 FL=1
MTTQERILDVLGGAKPLGMTIQTAKRSIRSHTRAGLNFAALEAIQIRYRIPLAQLQEVLGISDRTLARRRAQRLLSKGESDRLYRVARLGARAEEVLGSIEAVERWLKEPQALLDSETPLALLDTDEGAQMVGDLLGRIEHGVYS